MAVRAMYNYTYEYEGCKISFKKDEEFQLLAKSNKDWWQVRRWSGEGCAQDIYVPAVYVKEVKSEPKKRENLYQNISDVRKQITHLSTQEKSNGDLGSKSTAPTVLPKVVANNPSEPVISPSHKRPPLVAKRSFDKFSEERPNHVDLSKTAPLSVLERLSRQSSYRKAAEIPPAPSTSSKPRSKSTANDLNSPKGLPSPQESGPVFKIPPPTKPKGQKPVRERPQSMVVTSPTNESPPELAEPQVRVNAVASALEAAFAAQLSKESDGVLRSSSGPRHRPVHTETSKPADITAKSLNLHKTPSPKSEVPNLSSMSNGTEERSSPVSPSLPPDWTEHKTSSGHLYYYNTSTGQSSWTRPSESADSTAENTKSQLEKRPPRGWTRQINPITSTPIYTNSRTGERWSVASDGAGNFYYYNMTNPSLTVGELPAVAEAPVTESAHATPTRAPFPQENIYDTLAPIAGEPENQPRAPVEEIKPMPPAPVFPVASHLGVFANSLSGSMNKHGYVHRKKVHDSQGKKCKSNWQKLYVMLQSPELLFYSDHKSRELSGAKPLSTFSLLHATIRPCAKEKDKKKNAFQVSSPFGEQFLLQADSMPIMNNWYTTIQATIDSTNQEYKDHPERFKDSLPEDDGEHSPKLKKGRRALGRSTSNAEELVDDENDPMFMDDITPEDKSVRVRTRLKKLMAKRPHAEQLRKKGILEDPVFGCELETLCEREGSNVPRFLVRFMEHIEKEGLDVVGIYRLSGNAASVTKLRYQVDQGEDNLIHLDDQEWADINIVTGCLKLYLRELPDPIIPFRMFRSFIDSARASSQAERVQNIVARVMDLPKPNYCTLKALIQHFKKVVEHGHVNKMQASNVAIVFGPTLMRAEMDSMEMAILMPVQNGIVEIMINNYESVFRK